jgi:hypothetical protein
LNGLQFDKVLETDALQELLSPAIDKLLRMFDVSWDSGSEKLLEAFDLMAAGLCDHYKRCLAAWFNSIWREDKRLAA